MLLLNFATAITQKLHYYNNKNNINTEFYYYDVCQKNIFGGKILPLDKVEDNFKKKNNNI